MMFLKEFEHAEELVGEIGPSASHYVVRGSYLYRGHATREWTLLPSALRDGVVLAKWNPHGHTEWGPVNPREMKIGALRHREVETYRDFFNRSDLHGLAIPEDTQDLRQLINRKMNDSSLIGGRWPKRPLWSSMALAQHHGVPTRLLDFTLNPLVAAYFAAIECIKKDPQPDKLAVWAVSRNVPSILSIPRTTPEPEGYQGSDAEVRRLEEVTAPAYGNPNLKAQEGLFLLFMGETAREDRLVNCRALENEPDIQDKLNLYTLPGAQAPNLLRILFRYGYDAARLFPGYYGIRRAQEETAKLDALHVV